METTAVSVLLATKKSIGQIGSSPLIINDNDGNDEEKGRSNNNSQPGVKGEQTDFIFNGFHFGAMACLAAAAFASNAFTFYLVGAAISVSGAANITVVFLAPFLVWQKQKLRRLRGMRAQQNRLREAVNRYTKERFAFTDKINKLSQQVDSLQGVAYKLESRAESAGVQVNRLVDVVQELSYLQKRTKEMLESQVLQRMLSAALKSDLNNDLRLDETELNLLSVRLSNIPGVIFHKDRFDAAVMHDNTPRELTVLELIAMTRAVLNSDSLPENEVIFELQLDNPLGKGRSSTRTSNGGKRKIRYSLVNGVLRRQERKRNLFDTTSLASNVNGVMRNMKASVMDAREAVNGAMQKINVVQ